MKWLKVIKTIDYMWLAIMGVTVLLVVFYFSLPSSGDELIQAFEGDGQPTETIAVHSD